jgi:opacity protein-like surface antigen
MRRHPFFRGDAGPAGKARCALHFSKPVIGQITMKHIILGAAALVLSVAASAENYIGATIGPSHIEIDCGLGTQCDDGDTGFKLYGGFDVSHQANLPVALEVSYIDFGKANTSALGLTTQSIEVSALTFGAAIRPKFTPSLTGVARLGLAYVDAKSSGLFASSSSKLKVHAGLGLEFALNKQFKLVGAADFTSYDTGRQDGSAHLLSIGAQYGF